MKPLPTGRRRRRLPNLFPMIALVGAGLLGYYFWPQLTGLWPRFDDGLVFRGEYCHATLEGNWEEVYEYDGGDEVEFRCEDYDRSITFAVSATSRSAPTAPTTLREAEERFALALSARVGTCKVLDGPKNVSSLRQKDVGLERVVRYVLDDDDTTAVLVAYESSEHYFWVFCSCPSEEWGANREAMHAATRGFRVGRTDRPDAPDRPSPRSPSSDAPSGEPAALPPPTPKVYQEFLERLRAADDLDERVLMLKDWQARGFIGFAGSWRDLVLALSGGPMDDDVDALVIEELADSPLTTGELVECLPRASLRVRRVLTARLAKAPESERHAFVEHLTESPSQNSPGVLEAFLVLGEVSPERVRQLVLSEGLALAKDRNLRTRIVEHARAHPSFLQALLSDPEPALRSLGCTLTARASGEGDAPLKLLTPPLSDSEVAVRVAAANALTKLGNPRATWALARRLAREPDPHPRERMLTTLASFEPKRTLALISSLHERDSFDDKRAAAIALRALPSKAALEPLQRSLQVNHPPVLRAALETVVHLAQRDGPATLQPCKARIRGLHVWSDVQLANLKAHALASLDK